MAAQLIIVRVIPTHQVHEDVFINTSHICEITQQVNGIFRGCKTPFDLQLALYMYTFWAIDNKLLHFASFGILV